MELDIPLKDKLATNDIHFTNNATIKVDFCITAIL